MLFPFKSEKLEIISTVSNETIEKKYREGIDFQRLKGNQSNSK